MPVSEFKKGPNKGRTSARPKPLSQKPAMFAVSAARNALARAQNVERNHPSKKHKALRTAAEKYVLQTINQYKKRKKAKKL